MHEMTLSALQRYIRLKDHHPDLKMDYFLKLSEEVGELAQALRQQAVAADENSFKGSIHEELCDVLYYTLALANLYEVDLMQWFRLKEQLNDEKYGTQHAMQLTTEE